ncbi:aldose 1-epimerase [Sphingomonas sp. PB4P5]|uniref:aldose 1-epimerase n=1 Tax=Parasphingomonas puruogangriensis TaxID=3096155 RepID=UPI002FCA64A7
MRIAAGDWAATLEPTGGAIASLTRRGVDVLRPSPVGARDPLSLASFPLVPYANRIANGAFSFESERHVVPLNYPGQAHPLHGVGWLSAWSVTASDATSATLAHAHAPDDAWPWRYAATQCIALDPSGLSVTLTLENTGDDVMPYSLGFHPYFARAGVATLAFVATGVWQADGAMLPTQLAAPDTLGDWSRGAPLARAALIDHCYTGWGGHATITHDDGAITLAGTGTPLLHFYLPPSQDFFCLEPVTAMPDAVNRGAAAKLAPGERREIAMTIRG